MVSRHIKRRGAKGFQNSSMVVTKRISKEEIMQDRILNNKNRNQSLQSEPDVNTGRAGHKPIPNEEPEAKPSDRQQYLNLDQIHALNCFKSRELFNINTNALFIKKKKKDPLLTDDDSDDDEDAIEDILRDDGESRVTRHRPESVHIDVNSYDVNKPIEHNIKNLRALIQKAKENTGTSKKFQEKKRN